jgi:hypothetical protein
MLLYALGARLSAGVVAALLTAMLIGLCAAEALRGARVSAP